jgi:hypothetical protein
MEALITWPESRLLVVGIVIEIVVSAWVIMLSCVWLHALEVLVADHRNYYVGIVDVVP